ncbi:MAG: hypothetical protein M3305_13035 [Actinomycetota bacterium]|nr:hypothetical protein [Actinomycetota bacterium]
MSTETSGVPPEEGSGLALAAALERARHGGIRRRLANGMPVRSRMTKPAAIYRGLHYITEAAGEIDS